MEDIYCKSNIKIARLNVDQVLLNDAFKGGRGSVLPTPRESNPPLSLKLYGT